MKTKALQTFREILNSKQQIKDKFQQPIPIAVGTRPKPACRSPAATIKQQEYKKRQK